jgi:hypothetical protein
MRHVFYDLAGPPRLPTRPQPFGGAHLFPGVDGIHIIQEKIRVDKIAVSGAHVHPRGSCVWPRPRPLTAVRLPVLKRSPIIVGESHLTLQHLPTSLETDVFSSAALRRAQRAA